MPNTTTSSSGYKEIETKDFYFLKSYQTIVAAKEKKSYRRVLQTEEFYSQTTSRHIKLFKNRYLGLQVFISQKELDNLFEQSKDS